MEEANKAVVRRYIEEAWIQDDPDQFDAVIAPDAVFHDLVDEPGVPPGREGVKEMARRFRAGFPDFDIQTYDMLAEGDLVSFRWVSEGTHLGEFNGLQPTGRRASLTGMVLARLADGRIVEGWQDLDRFGLAQQLGFVPKKPMPRPLAKAMAFAIRSRDRLSRRASEA